VGPAQHGKIWDIRKNNGDSRITHGCGGEKRGKERGCALSKYLTSMRCAKALKWGRYK
jgi:hypothetical protein